MTSENHFRPIRSYVLRQGRKTPAQEKALTECWPQYGVNLQPTAAICWKKLFEKEAPIVLEIGFGMGDTLLAQAQMHPEINYVGIEVHRPGVGRCMALAQKRDLKNIKIFCNDAIDVLTCVPQNTIDKVLLLFPDPWPKKKHHKRRLVQSHFVSLIAQKLKPGGLFHLATDWQPYAQHMLTILESSTLINYFEPRTFAPPSCKERIVTKFERRGEKLGHTIYDLIYQRMN